MRLSHLLLAALATTVMATAGGGEPPVIYFGHDQVAAAFAGKGSLVDSSDLRVLAAHRSEPGKVELHEKETDVFYVVDGEATFITGGKMVGGKVTSPGQWMGTDIQGGQVHHLTKGDVIVIRAGVPHWFKEVPHSFSYFVVKAVKP